MHHRARHSSSSSFSTPQFCRAKPGTGSRAPPGLAAAAASVCPLLVFFPRESLSHTSPPPSVSLFFSHRSSQNGLHRQEVNAHLCAEQRGFFSFSSFFLWRRKREREEISNAFFRFSTKIWNSDISNSRDQFHQNIRKAFSCKLDEKHLLDSGVWQTAHIFGTWRTNLAKFSTAVWQNLEVSELVKRNV